jgi:hypothetical protein
MKKQDDNDLLEKYVESFAKQLNMNHEDLLNQIERNLE